MENKIKTLKFIFRIMMLFSTLLMSCNRGVRSDKTQSTISNEQHINIFKELVRTEPIHCFATTLDSKECIICLANKTGVTGDKMFYGGAEIVSYKLTKFANAWRVQLHKSIIADEYKYFTFYDKFELVTIGEDEYLYFEYKTDQMGTAASHTYIMFSLLSLRDFQFTTLDYGGFAVYDSNSDLRQIKGDFTNIGELGTVPEVLKFLEEKASKSSLVYRPTSDDLDINSAKNYEKKWEVDNPKFKNISYSYSERINVYYIKTTYYEESIFPSNRNVISMSIENNKFKIISMFRNNILGYDKTKKKYFPILVEWCSHGCDKDVSFLNDTTIQITYSEANNERIIVDLHNFKCDIIY